MSDMEQRDPERAGGFIIGAIITFVVIALTAAIYFTIADAEDDDVVVPTETTEAFDADVFVLDHLERSPEWAKVCDERNDVDPAYLPDIAEDIELFESAHGDLSSAGEARLAEMLRDC